MVPYPGVLDRSCDLHLLASSAIPPGTSDDPGEVPIAYRINEIDTHDGTRHT